MAVMSGFADMCWWIDSGDEKFPEFHRDTIEWVRGLGLDPNRLAPRAAVVLYRGAYELHVDEILRGEHGDRIDPLDEDTLLHVRRIVPVAKDSWPARPAQVAA